MPQKNSSTNNRSYLKTLPIILLLSFAAVAGKAQVKTNLHLCLRDEATGEWLIGLFPDCAIYDCHYWDYMHADTLRGRYILTRSDGQRIAMELKKRTRRGHTIYKYSIRPFTDEHALKGMATVLQGRFLPDYPVKDLRQGFRDNVYGSTDSVTVTGWFRNQPQGSEQLLRIGTPNLATDADDETTVQLDAQGRFCVKFPLSAASFVWFECGDNGLTSVLEPDRTYFLLYDCESQQQLWMGSDARLQNELASHELNTISTRVNHTPHGKLNAKEFWALADSVNRMNQALLEQMVERHPTLSERYIAYQQNNILVRMGRDMMQAMYYAPSFHLPREYVDYVAHEIWSKVSKPYTLSTDFPTFLHDYVEYHTPKSGTIDLVELLNMLDGSDADSIRTFAEVEGLERTAERHKTELFAVYELSQKRQLADSIGCDSILLSAVVAAEALNWMDQQSAPLTLLALSYARRNIPIAAMWTPVQAMNDSLLSFFSARAATSVALADSLDESPAALRVPEENLTGITDGRQLLDSILAPFRGRVVYIDVWGTWCMPCREEMTHVPTLRESLSDLPVVYLYLCNNSTDELWRNCIERYALNFPDAVHYNLPTAQQAAIERALGVHQYPTYRLADTAGRLLPGEVSHPSQPAGVRQTILNILEKR